MKHVIVVGAGVAGTAAALAASRPSARVTVIDDVPGASVLAGGAIDDLPWEEAHGDVPASLDDDSRAVLDALGAYRVTEGRAAVAVTTGLVRPARGVDLALLDLALLRGKTVLVVGAAHGSWDPEALVRAWSAAPVANELGVRFAASLTSVLLRAQELSFATTELARLHDDPRRLSWLAARVASAVESYGSPVDAVLLPPLLGVERERATELSRLSGLVCGEALSGVSGPSGLRFERARDRALAAANVVRVRGRVTQVEGEAPRVTLLDETVVVGDAVVLATGGLLGGGLEYTPSGAYYDGALPETPRAVVRVTVDAPVCVGARGKPLGDPGSLFGASPETHAWPYVETPLLDHVGVLVDTHGHISRASPTFFAAGEVAADVPRTFLASLASGARAGRAAARR
jgi:glycerol-3-phosphate dehydrogenase subunit B